MNLDDLSPYALMHVVDNLVEKAMRHEGMSQEDKAVLLQGRLTLSSVRRRHMPKKRPIDPATLPRGGQLHVFTPTPGLPTGWLENWEGTKEELAS